LWGFLAGLSFFGLSSCSELSEDDSTWISWFCALKGNEFFCEVDEAYIQDEFNLTGLAAQVPYYDYALDTILDIDTALESLTEEQQEMVDSAAELLYGLIHARFVLTARGLNSMAAKYEDVTFGRCHRVHCEGQPMLPVGRSDVPRKYGVTLYCPRCNDVYYPKSRRHGKIDGAYFGTTFPHLFLLTFPQLVPPQPTDSYAPRVFGFRLYTGASEGLARAAANGAENAAATAGMGYQEAAKMATGAMGASLDSRKTAGVRLSGHIAHLTALEGLVGAERAAAEAGPPLTIEQALEMATACTDRLGDAARIGKPATGAGGGGGTGSPEEQAEVADEEGGDAGPYGALLPGVQMQLLLRVADRQQQAATTETPTAAASTSA
jgi:casein kinase II subunit beta